MVAPNIDPAREVPPSADQRVFLRGLAWKDYERLLEVRGDSGGVRMTYLEGVLEIMSPSRDHERIKKQWARLLEAYCDEKGLDMYAYGSWTLKNEPKERGAEPDECYVLGPGKDVPDLALEVVWTSGGIAKLDVYRGLGVREVWIWRDGRIGVYLLRGDRYESTLRSELLPDLHLDLMTRFLADPDQPRAVRDYRQALRQR